MQHYGVSVTSSNVAQLILTGSLTPSIISDYALKYPFSSWLITPLNRSTKEVVEDSYSLLDILPGTVMPRQITPLIVQPNEILAWRMTTFQQKQLQATIDHQHC